MSFPVSSVLPAPLVGLQHTALSWGHPASPGTPPWLTYSEVTLHRSAQGQPLNEPRRVIFHPVTAWRAEPRGEESNLTPVRAVLLLVCWTGKARDNKERNEQTVPIPKVLLHVGNGLADPLAANLQFWMITFEVIDTP